MHDIGRGKEYDPETKALVYVGGFREDVHDGDGTEYDKNGAKTYEGRFQLGSYSGSGVLYDAATGKVLAEGEFRNGVLLTPKAELDAAKNPTEPETAAKEPETETAAAESESAPETAAEAGNTAEENETAAESTAAQIPGRTKRTGIGPGYED